MDNLVRAFEERDSDLYESLLDDGFWFTEVDCQGELNYYWDREVERAIMGGRDDSMRGIFDVFRTIEFAYHFEDSYDELGADSPMAFEGDPDGHPEEDWHVYRGWVELLLLESRTQGFLVDQVMSFKLRQDEAGIWRIRRWADDSLSTDCSERSGKAAVEADSWGRIKARFFP